ncbi:MAG: hypothetical protein BWY58_01883 [Chloroflexi bacterium ADurb.Bin344]|nr:MAG: hypothetical protein BWY58_01883 [Chloroflexi bacterium ADurb.Bin344]
MDKKIAPKIAIVHDYLIKLGGAEKVLEVIHQIFPDAPIYTLYMTKKAQGEFLTVKIIKLSHQNCKKIMTYF